GISLFALAREANGVALVPYRTLDGVCAAEVSLSNAPGALVGEEGGAFGGIAAAFDQGVAAICAEAAGALQATLDTTVEYTKTRMQFGVPIAKFQVLQHRMVEMLIHVEQARSMSYLAAMRAAESPSRERRRALAAAKVVVGNACRFVGQQAVQLHGGMGGGDETAVGHLFWGLAALEVEVGGNPHHLGAFLAADNPGEGIWSGAITQSTPAGRGLDTPPVNALAYAVRAGILAELDKANSDPAVSAVVLAGAGRSFSAGADINELGTPKSLLEPNLLTVIREIERSGKPVVAAIHGVATG